MTRHSFRLSAPLIALFVSCAMPMVAGQDDGPTETEFSNPPHDARPWVWGHWLHGNVSRECITRELDAIKRAGLCGMTMFDVAQQGIPAGPHAYMEQSWRDHFAFQIAEAERMGLEVMSHLGPGYSGTGGPWIKPELASQRVYDGATRVNGPKRFSAKLPQPETPEGFYRDVAVLAIRETKSQAGPNIEDFDMKRLVWLNYIRWKGTRSAPLDARIPADRCIAPAQVIDLTGRMKPDGSLDWVVPEGEWTILRFGHGWTGQKTLPATPEGTGPECDKLAKRGIRAHFDHVMKRMVELAGPRAGKTFHTFFMDSWEAGGQNWTAEMPAEFKRRRGYDIIPWLPVLTGRVIGDLRTSERFLYDLRLTVSELAVENFWSELHRLCRESGIRLAVQPYITTGQDLDAANHVDEPMGEFWSHPFQPNNYIATVKLASSAANLNGRLIVGAEAFTADERERWLAHPATLKTLGDQAFCLGANRFQFHRFAMQRFAQLKPGMTMGKWGQHYDSTQTWWGFVNPWHDYLARCQYLLQQGPVVTDVLALADEEPLHRFDYQPIPGHGSDVCGPDTFRRIEMIDGRPGIPGGPVYQLITVTHGGTMSVGRLRKLRDLVVAGANLLGEPPVSTPGLENLPAADAELEALARELWGTAGETERKVGAGKVFRSIKPEAALERLGVPPDFASPDALSWIHRRCGDTDMYFVANPSDSPLVSPCTFRVSGKRAELWDPETGRITPLAASLGDENRSMIRLPLAGRESAFVVFRPGSRGPEVGVTEVLLDGTSPKPAALNGGATVLPVEVRHAADGNVSADFHQSGVYQIRLSDGALRKTTIDLAPEQPLATPWTLRFPADSGVESAVQLKALIPWNKHRDPQVRHFSGTAVYSNRFDLPPTLPEQIHIDLGRVEVMARIRVNGQDLGILWRPPFVIDATKAVKPGMNQLQVEVVNLWPNRLIGDQFRPEDADRDPKGLLQSWPDWLLQGRQSPTGRRSFVTFPLWNKKDKLIDSGLIGPVSLRFPQTRVIHPETRN